MSESIELPIDFEWASGSLLTLDNVRGFLQENYRPLNKNYSQFLFQVDTLKWMLFDCPNQTFIIGIVSQKTQSLVGFISAAQYFQNATVNTESAVKLLAVNFLCIHIQFRGHRLTSLLTQELSRQATIQGFTNAIFTTGSNTLNREILNSHQLTTAKCEYIHRPLDINACHDAGVIRFENSTQKDAINKILQLPKTTTTAGFREMIDSDVKEVVELLNRQHRQHKIVAPFFTESEGKHWLLPKQGIISSFVVENSVSGKITDFISFVWLPTLTLKCCYLYYNTNLRLLEDVLIEAKRRGCQLFNIQTIFGNNRDNLKKLYFLPSKTDLFYHVVCSLSPQALAFQTTPTFSKDNLEPNNFNFILL